MITNEFEKGKKFSFSDRIEYADNAIVSKHILKKSTGNVTLFAFSKNEGLSEHTTPFDALVHIVDGKADIIINGESNILISGESIVMPANEPHSLLAVENFKMVLVMIRESN
jgi:quercetin dioxygenase-like cupin family protein